MQYIPFGDEKIKYEMVLKMHVYTHTKGKKPQKIWFMVTISKQSN